MGKVILPMLDGGIVDYSDDWESYPGCETCDYGSEYITEIFITLTKHKIHVKLNNMYEYAISESGIMKTILPEYENIKEMTEKEFADWFKCRLCDLMDEKFYYTPDYDDIIKIYHVENI